MNKINPPEPVYTDDDDASLLRQLSSSSLQIVCHDSAFTSFLLFWQEILYQARDGVECMAATIDQNPHKVAVLSTAAERSESFQIATNARMIW